ncbi:hypothetical protein CDAR_249381 [Caerostris darwini]|uniref:Uncharacterized protein n=1 Tax=Caerostris darwini TaxID=1538125 RepID=A0AAV4TE36_9ARAC|nr:hypothetical protein CDAR_249381 [Caerostris darwini]
MMILVGSECCPPAGGEATYDSRLLSFPTARLSGFGLYGASYAASNSFYTALALTSIRSNTSEEGGGNESCFRGYWGAAGWKSSAGVDAAEELNGLGNYSEEPSPYDLKESRSSWSALQQSSAAACYPYDPSGLATCASYPDR